MHLNLDGHRHHKMASVEEYKNRTYINYGPSFVYALLQNVTDEYFIWNNWLDINRNLGILQSYGNLLSGPKTPIIDRTGLLAPPLKSKLIDPIPEIGSFNKNFDTLMFERAKELLGRGYPIDVHWSGGIDSVAALVALLQVSDDWSQITIILDDYSIEEYPLFFEKFIKGKLNYVLENELSSLKYRPRTHLCINGQGSAQIFGSIGRDLFEKRNEAWSYTLENQLVHKDPALNAELLEVVSEHILRAPYEIKTLYDFFWWIRFSIQFQHGYVMMYNYVTIESKQDFENIQAFYNTPDFQRWGMVNPDLRIRDTYKSYKWVLKDFIYNFTHDSDYRDNKCSERSLVIWKYPGNGEKLFQALDENFQQVDFQEWNRIKSEINSSLGATEHGIKGIL